MQTKNIYMVDTSRTIIKHMSEKVIPEVRKFIKANAKTLPEQYEYVSETDNRFKFLIVTKGDCKQKPAIYNACFADGDVRVFFTDPESIIKYELKEPEKQHTTETERYSDYLLKAYDTLTKGLADYTQYVSVYLSSLIDNKGERPMISVVEINKPHKYYIDINIFDDCIESHLVNGYENYNNEIKTVDDVIDFVKQYFAKRKAESEEIADVATTIINNVREWQQLLVRYEYPNRSSTTNSYYYYHPKYPTILIPMYTPYPITDVVQNGFFVLSQELTEFSTGCALKGYTDNIYIPALVKAQQARYAYEYLQDAIATVSPNTKTES